MTQDPRTGGAGPDGPGGEGGDREDAETYRGRMWAAAARRQVPLATILTTVVVVVLVLDVNAFVVLLAWVLRTVILYVVLALFLALLLSPVVRLVGRTGIGRGWSVTITFIGSVVVLGGVVVLFTAPLIHAVTHFAKELPTLVKQAEHGKGRLGHLLAHFHLEAWMKKNAPRIASDITKAIKPAQALSVGSAALSTLVAMGAVAVLTLFLLLEGPGIRATLLRTMNPSLAARVARVWSDSSRSVTGYMFGNVLTSVIAGVVIAVTLLIVGVPYPFLLGLWVALVDLLPMVGGLLAGVPVVILAAFHSLPAFVVTAIVFLVYQQLENHVLNPLIMSRTVRLSPLWVLLAVLVAATLGSRVGSDLGAFVGALIGIPVGGAAQVVAREIRRGPEAAPLPAVAGGEGPGAVP